MIGNHPSETEEKDEPYFIDNMLISMIVETDQPERGAFFLRDVNV